MTRIFISATLRTEYNKQYNRDLCSALENLNYDCFLPQRDVDTSTRFSIANDNLLAIGECDVFVSVVNTDSPNLAFEAGYAYALKKNMIIIKNRDYVMPDMFYGIVADCQTIEANDLEMLEHYLHNLVSGLESFM